MQSPSLPSPALQGSGPPENDDRRYVGFLISDVARMMRATFDRRVRRIGLTRAQWQVLNLLHRRPGASQTELAEMLEVERATAGRMIDRLEKKSWVERRADATDRRINRLFLTADAMAIQSEMRRIGENLLDDAMVGLTDDERDVLADMMERVKTQLQTMAPRNGNGAALALRAVA